MKKLVTSFKSQLKLYKRVYDHPETSMLSKLLLGAAIGYLCMPIDLIPDCIPVLGQLDDLVIVPLLVLLAYWSLPKRIIAECRISMEIPTTDGQKG